MYTCSIVANWQNTVYHIVQFVHNSKLYGFCGLSISQPAKHFHSAINNFKASDK